MADIDEFVTDIPRETKNLLWRIKNFRANLASGIISNFWIEFGVGESIGMASKWKLQVSHNINFTTCFHLSVGRTTGQSEAKHFRCTAILKKKDNENLISFNLNPAAPTVNINFDQITNAIIEDELAIHVAFILCSNTFVTNTVQDSLSNGAEALNNYEDLLKSGDNSDFVIQVNTFDEDGESNEKIPVHRSILSARSSVFKTMLDAQMQEREKGILVIEDLSPKCVKVMLKYIYTGNLDNDWKRFPEEMVRASDKYNLPLLFNFLNQRLHCVCTFVNAMKLRQLANLYRLNIAAKNINKFIASNIDKILD